MKKDYIEFQERNLPLAYFISFRCYGTWLHGDERGSVDRKKFNQFGAAKIAPNKKWQDFEATNLNHPPTKLNSQMRPVIENAIREVCENRNYKLYAVQARTEHVHSVVSATGKPEPILNAFKAYATRHLREKKLISKTAKMWSRHGSTPYLWTEEQIEIAVDYVLNRQGEELPKF